MMNFILGIAALCGIADFVIERIVGGKPEDLEYLLSAFLELFVAADAYPSYLCQLKAAFQ